MSLIFSRKLINLFCSCTAQKCTFLSIWSSIFIQFSNFLALTRKFRFIYFTANPNFQKFFISITILICNKNISFKHSVQPWIRYQFDIISFKRQCFYIVAKFLQEKWQSILIQKEMMAWKYKETQMSFMRNNDVRE